MTITAQYTNPEHTILKRSDMPNASIPAVGGNRDYQELIELGVTIADYIPPSGGGNPRAGAEAAITRKTAAAKKAAVKLANAGKTAQAVQKLTEI
jgi:hypothetical protein